MAKQVKAQPTEPRWRDLREWLDVVEGLGELKRVQGANSEEDIGAVTEMLDHAEESPSLLFDEIPNFKPGYRVLVNSMGSRKRQAVTLGLDPAEASHDRLLQFWRELLKGFAPIPPINVKRGPFIRSKRVGLGRRRARQSDRGDPRRADRLAHSGSR